MALISIQRAREVFRDAVQSSRAFPVDSIWEGKIKRLSELCEIGGSFTHIAFMGTAILAKSSNSELDLRAIKPTHALPDAKSYSARSLCHTVLVPLSAELGVDLGVSGREPLNNQPYFRMTSLGDGTPIHVRSRPAFYYMLELIDELQKYDSNQAIEVLRAYISVRSKAHVSYDLSDSEISISPLDLVKAISLFVNEGSEGGKRAQAVVAGIFDTFAGPDRVDSGRINDPSRHYPGDVVIKGDDEEWEKSIEVRDKVVSESDVYIFARMCRSKGIFDAALVLASPKQQYLDYSKIASWAAKNSMGITLFYGWDILVDQAFFWTGMCKPDATVVAVNQIENRLIAVEASPEAITRWQILTRG